MNKFLKFFSIIGVCFFGLFGLNKVVKADSINVNYDGNYEMDNYVLDGTYNGSDYEFFVCNLYCVSTVNYFISNISFLTSLEIDTTDIEDINIGFYYCFGGSYCTSVSEIFSSFNVNYYDYFFETPRSEPYNVLRFTYNFDTPFSLDTGDFYFYVGVKNEYEVTPWFSVNHFMCLPNSYESNENNYNLGYNDASRYYNDYYSNLVSDYDTLQETYNTLNSNYTSLQTTYNTLFTNYNILQEQYNDLLSHEYSFSSFFWSISAVPFGVLGSMLNFDLLGVNLFGLVSGILTAFIVVWLIKKFLIK